MKHKLTNLDTAQITRYSYDEENQAQRVVITNSDFGDALKDAVSKIELPKLEMGNIEFKPYELPKQEIVYVDKLVKETEVVQVQKNVFIPEIQVIEKPIIIKELQILRVPEYITVHKTEIVEKPVVIKEYEKIPNLLKYCFYAFVCIEFINLFKSLMK